MKIYKLKISKFYTSLKKKIELVLHVIYILSNDMWKFEVLLKMLNAENLPQLNNKQIKYRPCPTIYPRRVYFFKTKAILLPENVLKKQKKKERNNIITKSIRLLPRSKSKIRFQLLSWSSWQYYSQNVDFSVARNVCKSSSLTLWVRCVFHELNISSTRFRVDRKEK